MPLPGLKAATLFYLNALQSDQLVKATNEIGDGLTVFTGWILAINQAGDNFLADLQDFTPSRQSHSPRREKTARVSSATPPVCDRIGDQKLSFMPSCMIRGSRVEVTSLYSEEMRLVEAQQMGLVWLKVLKVSKRN